MQITTASDSSIRILIGDSVSEETQERVAALTKKLLGLRDHRIRNIHPAYASVLIDFDPLLLTHEELAAILRGIDLNDKLGDAVKSRIVEIPVCYGHEFGLDLENVANELMISPEEVIRRHAAGIYPVSFFGFSPGFAYLSGLTDFLHVARLESPRRLVKSGSVAIAGTQTGVYSGDSPGGWRVLGRTPLRMFDPETVTPTPLEIGDRVKFLSITREEFDLRDREHRR